MDLIWNGRRILVPGGNLHIGWTEPTLSYPSVTIGTQVWMAKNVDDNIPGSKVPGDNESNRSIYGGLYQWTDIPTIESLYPGWHVPTFSEWQTLHVFLGPTAGGKLKETGTTHWQSPNTGALNSYGWTGLPAGYEYYGWTQPGTAGHFWASTETSPGSGFGNMAYLSYDNATLLTNASWLTYSCWLSIRLLKNS